MPSPATVGETGRCRRRRREVHRPQPTTAEVGPGVRRGKDGKVVARTAACMRRRWRDASPQTGVSICARWPAAGPAAHPAAHVDEFTEQSPKQAAPARPAPDAASGERAAAASSATAGPLGEVIPMSRMRQAIARRMSQSKREAPHYYLLVEIDMTDALALRRQINDAQNTDEARVSINDLIVKACGIALQRHPQFNATIAGDEVTHHTDQNVCMAIALEEGLIAPALLDVGRKGLADVARETRTWCCAQGRRDSAGGTERRHVHDHEPRAFTASRR